MTTVTVVAPTPTVDLFSGLPDSDQVTTPYPRGQLVFSCNDDQFDAGAVGENQLGVIDCVLPVGYAYALAEVHMVLRGANVTNWSSISALGVYDNSAASGGYYQGVGLQCEGFSNGVMAGGDNSANRRKLYTYYGIPTQVITPVVNDTGLVSLMFSNDTDNDIAALATGAIRVYQFEVEQANNYSLHTAVSVRGAQ